MTLIKEMLVWLKAIRRRLLLTERDGVTDETFYAKK